MKLQKTINALRDVSRELRALSHLFENQDPSVSMIPHDMDVVNAGLANMLERYGRRVKRSAAALEEIGIAEAMKHKSAG